MKIITTKLKAALENLRRVHGRRQSLPILGCVKLVAANGTLEITASNLDEYMIERAECEGDLELICASPNYILGAIGGESVTIELVSGHLEITSPFGVSKIPTMEAEEFPKMPTLEKAEKHGVSCADLSKMISGVLFCASEDQARYVLQSVYLESKAKKLVAVATNGRDLALIEAALIGSDFKITAPSAFCGNFSNALLREGASLSSSENWILVEHESGAYYCKQLEGNYPNYKQVIPSEKTNLGEVATEELKSLVARCLVFTEQSEAKTVFEFSKKALTVSFVGDKNAQLKHTMDGKFSPFTVALNARSIHKILSNIKTESVTLFFTDELSPLRFESGDLMVITMPMRLA